MFALRAKCAAEKREWSWREIDVFDFEKWTFTFSYAKVTATFAVAGEEGVGKKQNRLLCIVRERVPNVGHITNWSWKCKNFLLTIATEMINDFSAFFSHFLRVSTLFLGLRARTVVVTSVGRSVWETSAPAPHQNHWWNEWMQTK